jgi:hypothetical protein
MSGLLRICVDYLPLICYPTKKCCRMLSGQAFQKVAFSLRGKPTEWKLYSSCSGSFTSEVFSLRGKPTEWKLPEMVVAADSTLTAFPFGGNQQNGNLRFALAFLFTAATFSLRGKPTEWKLDPRCSPWTEPKTLFPSGETNRMETDTIRGI